MKVERPKYNMHEIILIIIFNFILDIKSTLKYFNNHSSKTSFVLHFFIF